VTEIVVAYARFVEVQQRRARIVEELNHAGETQPLCTPPPATDEPTEGGERPTRDVDANPTRGVADGR